MNWQDLAHIFLMKRAQLAPRDSVTTRGICNLVAGSFLAFVAHVFLKLLCGLCVAFVAFGFFASWFLGLALLFFAAFGA